MNRYKIKNFSIKKYSKLLMILCCIISIFIIGFQEKPITKASSYGIDYFVFSQDDYENPYIGHIGNCIVKFLDGKISYCLQSGKGLQRGVNYTLKEDLNWSLESKELLSYVLYYGYQDYHGTSIEQYSDEDLAYYLATQLLVWQLEYNSFYDTKLTESLIEHYAELKTDNGALIGPKVVNYYNEIWNKSDIALNGGTPSFTYDSDYLASLNTYVMEYDEEKEGFYLEIEDTNQYLKNFQISECSNLEVTISDNKIAIFCKDEFEEDKSIILNNPYFAKGMQTLIWTCDDVAYQEITNGKDTIDVSKIQYIYVKTQSKPENDDNPPSTEDTPGEDVPDTEDEPGEDTPNTEDEPVEEIPNTEDEPEENAPDTEDEPVEEIPNTEDEPEEDAPDTEDEPDKDVPDTEDEPDEDAPDIEDEPEEEIPNTEDEPEKEIPNTEDVTEEEIPNTEDEETENIPEIEEEKPEGTNDVNTEEIFFEEEYNYNSNVDDLPNGRIIIEKIDGDTGETLPGVSFYISNYDNTYSCTLETDENGIIDLFLPYDNYYFQEISALEGYATNNEKVSFRITDETPLFFQIINTKVPRLGMNFYFRNILFAALLALLIAFIFRELRRD